jgi:hypothetical protein
MLFLDKKNCPKFEAESLSEKFFCAETEIREIGSWCWRWSSEAEVFAFAATFAGSTANAGPRAGPWPRPGQVRGKVPDAA